MGINKTETPVLFLIYNRPEKTQRVFDRLKEIKPKYLYVSADGPKINSKDDFDNCIKTREIINRVDWNCELQTNFNQENLGCKIGVSSGINWFFKNVDEGIILEDDCIPDPSFFSFCSLLLEKYRDNNKVMHIGGVNFQDGEKRGIGSYYFSLYNHVWGWATWKKAWNLYDVDIKNYPAFIKSDIFKSLIPLKKEQKYWIKYFSQVYNHQKDTWDYQWTFTIWQNQGLSIVPNQNLVSNIGFDESATHTIFNSSLANKPTEDIGEIIHPDTMLVDINADRYTFNKYMNINKIRKLFQLLFL
jgi:hypothetical protein